MNKELIKKRFQKNIETYAENAKVQKQMAEKLLTYLEEEEYSQVLEIGCGVGILTEKLCSKIKYDSYTANDIVPDCEQYLNKISENINFVCEDIEEYILNYSNQFDLIISNASFQWVEDFEKFIHKLLKKLKPNGILIFSTFGKENFREIRMISDKTITYYSKSELENILNSYSCKTDEEIYVLSFKTPREVLKHIKLTGVNSIENTHWTKSDLTKFENAYNNFCSQKPTLTYNPIYVKVLNRSAG